MRVSLHVMFAGLLVVGFATAVSAGTPGIVTLIHAPVLALAYLAGTLAEHRRAGMSRLAPLWLTVVLAVWAVLICDSADFVWLLFPLVFVIQHVLPRIPALIVVAVAWLAAVGLPVATGQWDLTAGSVIGPLVGTLAAVAGFRFYRALRDDADEQRRIAATLRETRRELAATENRAGRLAERERLGREIHDTLAQGLSSILLLSRAAQRSLDNDDIDAARGQVSAVKDAASDNLAEARRFVAGLNSPVLSESLSDALHALIAAQRARLLALGDPTRLELTVLDDRAPDPSDEVAGGVMRVVQEALNNALKHAEASAIVVTYAVFPDEVTVDIVDDGHGFDPLDVTATPDSGFGLAGLRARVAELDGQLTIESSPTGGTAIAATFPRS